MLNRQTTLDLNGPILSIATNPLSVNVGCATSGIATFVGIATASFPTQTPLNSATPTGSISYQWYLESYGTLTDGAIAGLGITVVGSATTTLTISYISNLNIIIDRVYFSADYVPSAYGQEPITAGTARSTGNAINEPVISQKAVLSSNPDITISKYPEIATVSSGTNARFNITASTTESDSSALAYQWYANGVSLVDGSNTVVVQSPNQSTTTTAPGFNGSGIYLDLTDLTGNVYATISTYEESGIFHYINIPGVGNIPENYGSQTVTLSGGRIYGPCSAPFGGLYIGNETPVGGIQTLVVEEGGDDWNDMILYINQGYFRRLTSAPTVTVPGTGPVNATDTVSGATSPNLVISCNTVGIQTIQCKISHPTACNSPLYSNIINLNVISARPIINIETFEENGSSNATLSSLDLTSVGTINLDATNTLGLTSLYAAEEDVDVIMELYGSKGLDLNGYVGGQGGKSTISFTMKKGDEYVITRIPQSSANGGIFLYRKSRLIAAVGSGGNAGTSANGGSGGGVNVAGSSDTSRGAGAGGSLIAVGALPSNGIFGSTASSSTTILSGDSIASAPNGGRTISCAKGNYWRNQGYAACQDIGSNQFYRSDGSVVSNTDTINRGFKAGYSILTTSGAGTNNGGNGGNGATGGNGGTGGAGGGGGSGYSDGSITIITTQLGGNNDIARVVIKQKLGDFYVDSVGRILILSAATAGRDPSTLVKTTGKVLPGTDTCIDDARWQNFLNLAETSNYRLTATLDNSTTKITSASPNNIQRMKNANYITLKTSLTDWQLVPYSYTLKCLAWDEDSINPGYGSDYSILSWGGTSYYYGYYGQSSNTFFSITTYSNTTANWWILPPGVPDF
jgi:hypothetical protein